MKSTLAVAIVAGLAASASAQVELANWTFESSVPTTSGPHAAEHGVFAAASLASSNGAGVFSNPVGNGSPESFSSNGWEIGTYYEFSTSAAGYESLSFSWMQTRSGTGPDTFELALSIDGGAFINLLDYTVPQITWSSLAPAADTSSEFGPIGLPASAADATSLVFRLINQAAPGGSGGTNRVDNVILTGTLIPAPGAAALLGLGALLATRRRRD